MKHSGKSRFWIAGIILAVLILAVAPAAAAKGVTSPTIGYLTIPGATDGCSSVKGYENSCLVYGFEQGVTATGSSSGGGGGAGKAELSLSLTKPVDRASVAILKDAVTGVHLMDATIQLAPYSIKLSGVTITGVRQYFDALGPDQASLGQLEEVTFGFEGITWGWDPDLRYCFSVILNSQCPTLVV
jgi:type VI secretion system secreted protein Hcp